VDLLSKLISVILTFNNRTIRLKKIINDKTSLDPILPTIDGWNDLSIIHPIGWKLLLEVTFGEWSMEVIK